jgi:hypothetical protein
MNPHHKAALAMVFLSAFLGCGGEEGAETSSSGTGGGGGGGEGPTRSFALGTTPFPYDLTAEAVDWVYEHLATDGDLYAFHTMEGVPWVEALAEESYGASLLAKWGDDAGHVTRDHAVYLALTPLDDSRSKLAPHWGVTAQQPLPPPWDTATFDSPEVKQAYLRFCEDAIQFYQPDYLAIGIEVNLLARNEPAAWPGFVELHRATYQALKLTHPELPIFATFTGMELLDGATDADPVGQASALADLLPYTDIVAFSLYPYMSVYLTGPLPDDLWGRLGALSGGKPIAVAESGYPAEAFTLTTPPLTFEGTPEKQAAFVGTMLAEAESRKMPFVVNFVLRDYDALWAALYEPGTPEADVGLLWRDTGLYDGEGEGRPALAAWLAALARPR